MNPQLKLLHSYPFEKLAALKISVEPAKDKTPITLALGEPKHTPPSFIGEAICKNLSGYSSYPLISGCPELRQSIATWLQKRFHLSSPLDPEQNILPCNGTREALFAIAQCVVDHSQKPLVLMPNPFYQIYEGAALLAGAEPYYINTTEKTQLLPDFATISTAIWKRCQLLYLCTPGNPTGAVLRLDQLKAIIDLSYQYSFVIASDECYSEIYFDETNKPCGLLEAASQMGISDLRNLLVFNSLSKRSSVPGLRSGLIAGDAKLIKQFALYRTYHGSAMPIPTQIASIPAWADEQHVIANRLLYRKKFAAVIEILQSVTPVHYPQGGIFLWLKTPIDDLEFTKELYRTENVTVLPGSYLSRSAHGSNPGAGYVRIALVAEHEECLEAANRIKRFLLSLKEQP